MLQCGTDTSTDTSTNTSTVADMLVLFSCVAHCSSGRGWLQDWQHIELLRSEEVD